MPQNSFRCYGTQRAVFRHRWYPTDTNARVRERATKRRSNYPNRKRQDSCGHDDVCRGCQEKINSDCSKLSGRRTSSFPLPSKATVGIHLAPVVHQLNACKCVHLWIYSGVYHPHRNITPLPFKRYLTRPLGDAPVKAAEIQLGLGRVPRLSAPRLGSKCSPAKLQERWFWWPLPARKRFRWSDLVAGVGMVVFQPMCCFLYRN